MSQKSLGQASLLETLEANHLMHSFDEVVAFEQALAELVHDPNPADLPNLHLSLNDACQQPEVMFGLVHFLESFELPDQLQAFIQVMPDLAGRAPEWTAILHSRINNDPTAQATFEEMMRAMDTQKQDEIQQLLSSVAAKLNSGQVTKVA